MTRWSNVLDGMIDAERRNRFVFAKLPEGRTSILADYSSICYWRIDQEKKETFYFSNLCFFSLCLRYLLLVIPFGLYFLTHSVLKVKRSKKYLCQHRLGGVVVVFLFAEERKENGDNDDVQQEKTGRHALEKHRRRKNRISRAWLRS